MFCREDVTMGILDDVKRLGIELSEDDKNEIEAIRDRVKAQKKDKLVQDTLARVLYRGIFHHHAARDHVCP